MQLVRELRQVGKPPELIDALSRLWGQDKEVERKLRRWRITFIGSLVAFFVSFFIVFPLEVPWVLLLILPVIVVSVILYVRYHRLNLDDRRILTPIKFLEVLGADIAPRDPVRLLVSFDHYRRHGRKLAESGSRGARKAKYEDTWLEVEGWLAERTRFRLVVTQRVDRSDKSKRKYTKTKERVRETVGLYLRPNRKLYPALERFPDQFSSGEEVAGLRIESARATARGLLVLAEGGQYTRISGRGTQETGTEHLIQGDKLLLLMASAYDRLNRCRTAA